MFRISTESREAQCNQASLILIQTTLLISINMRKQPKQCSSLCMPLTYWHVIIFHCGFVVKSRTNADSPFSLMTSNCRDAWKQSKWHFWLHTEYLKYSERLVNAASSHCHSTLQPETETPISPVYLYHMFIKFGVKCPILTFNQDFKHIREKQKCQNTPNSPTCVSWLFTLYWRE